MPKARGKEERATLSPSSNNLRKTCQECPSNSSKSLNKKVSPFSWKTSKLTSIMQAVTWRRTRAREPCKKNGASSRCRRRQRKKSSCSRCFWKTTSAMRTYSNKWRQDRFTLANVHPCFSRQSPLRKASLQDKIGFLAVMTIKPNRIRQESRTYGRSSQKSHLSKSLR